MLEKLFNWAKEALINEIATTDVAIDIEVVNNFDTYDSYEFISKINNSLENNNLEISYVSVKEGKNNDIFAFTQNGVYCRQENIVGDTPIFVNEPYIVKWFVNKAGKERASWLCPLALMDEKTKAIVQPIALSVIRSMAVEATIEAAEQAARQARWVAEAAAKQAKIIAGLDELGIKHYSQTTIGRSSSYGGRELLKFSFDFPIEREKFISFLAIIGKKTIAEHIDAPISQEEIHVYCEDSGRTWIYHWIGSWTD